MGGSQGAVLEGVRAFADTDFVKNKAQRGAVLGIINMLDPEIVNAKPWQKKRKLAAMADMMSENAILKITAGDVTGVIPADTATAVLNGAKKYIANTRLDMRGKMSVDEYVRYVDQEAGIMALTMLEIARTRAARPEMIQAQGNTMRAYENFLDEVSVSKLPEGQSVNDALTTAVEDLVNLRNINIDDAGSDVLVAQAGRDQIEGPSRQCSKRGS